MSESDDDDDDAFAHLLLVLDVVELRLLRDSVDLQLSSLSSIAARIECRLLCLHGS